jgi:hypothetical protein
VDAFKPVIDDIRRAGPDAGPACRALDAPRNRSGKGQVRALTVRSMGLPGRSDGPTGVVTVTVEEYGTYRQSHEDTVIGYV